MTQHEEAAPAPDVPPPPLSRWKAALFLSAVLLVFAGGLELGARFYLKRFHGFDGKHLLQYEFDAYKNILPTRNFVDTRGIRHNSVGFRRSGEVPATKPDSVYRIFLMGGSTAYGLGGLWPHIQNDYPVIDNTQTIDAYLERTLRDRFPGKRVEVINAAITSTWTHHSLIYLNQRILRYHPDMIVFLDGFNDFYHTAPGHDQFASYAYGEQSARILGDPTLFSLAFQNFWWFYRRSAFVHVMTREARKLTGYFRRPVRQPLDADRQLVALQQTFPPNALAMVSRYVRLASDAGVIAVEVHQPLLVLERERPGMVGVERQLFEFNVNSYLPNYEALMHRAVPWVTDTLGKAVRAAGGHFLDATRIYANVAGQVYTDYCHLTPHGNEVLAAYLSEHLAPLIQRDLASAGRGEATRPVGH